MNEGVALLRDHDRLLVENQSDHQLDSEITAINENLRLVNESLKRVKLGELTMTIVAPTSAGKSTVINAIAGQDLLPSRNDPMTVLPTEIVFSREVAKPELFLSEDLMTLLPKVWRLLHQELEEIGLEKAFEQATKKHFPRENVIQEIFKGSSVAFQSEVKESNRIQGELIRINDLLRLCGIFGIVTDLSQMPRIEVPFPPELSSLAGLGTLVLVDTPGVSEGEFLNLVNVVKERLEASSLVLVVVDYKNIKQTETVKKLVDKIAAVKGRDRIYIIVNKIDARDLNNSEELTTQQIFNLVKTQYEIDDPQNRVFEMSALEAFLATNFQREEQICSPTKLRESKSFDALGQKYYAKSWRTQKTIVTLEEMQKAADECLQDSGFVAFRDKAIAPLVTDAAPSMITIKGALNDISQKFADFLSCLSNQKGILEWDIQQLGIEINQLEIDLIETISICKNKECQEEMISSLMDIFNREIICVIDRDRNILLEKFNRDLDVLWERLLLLEPSGINKDSSRYLNVSRAREITNFIKEAYQIIDKNYRQITLNLKEKLLNQLNIQINYYYKSIFTQDENIFFNKFIERINSHDYSTYINNLQKKITKILDFQLYHFNGVERKLCEEESRSIQKGKAMVVLQDQLLPYWIGKPREWLDSMNVSSSSYKHFSAEGSVPCHTKFFVHKPHKSNDQDEIQIIKNGIEMAYNRPHYTFTLSSSELDEATSYYVTKQVIIDYIETFFTKYWGESGRGGLSDCVDSAKEDISIEIQALFKVDVEVFIEERDKFLKKYEKDLQSSIKIAKEKQSVYRILKNKYFQLLDKIANLENDLKYQQEYSKQH
jgi:hypothetical protein